MASWKTGLQVIRQLVKRYFRDHVGQSAAELAYYLLFSLFPLLVFIYAAISMLHLSPQILADTLGSLLPPQAADLVITYLAHIRGLDTPLLLYACLFLTVYAVSRAATSLIHSLTHAYRLRRQSRFSLSAGILLTLLLLGSLIVLMLLMVVSENLLWQIDRFITLPDLLIRLWNLLRLMVAPAYMLLVLTGLYATVGYGHYRLRQALPGAFFVVLIGFGVSTAFGYYITHAARYSVLYGSLAAFMVLMLWLYLMGAVIILGGELNHILANRKNIVGKGEST